MTIDDVIDENDEDNLYPFLSDHSRSMRRACNYCIKIFYRLDEATNAVPSTNRIHLLSIFKQGSLAVNTLRRTSRDHQTRRDDAHRAFWSSSLSSISKPSGVVCDDDSTNDSTPSTTIFNQIQTAIPIKIDRIQVRMIDDSKNNHDSEDPVQEICRDQVRCFKDQFQNLNVPCLITGLDRSPHFRFVSQHWRNNNNNNNVVNNNNNSASNCATSIRPNITSSKINREWFRDELGDDCLVPLRYSPLSDGERGDSGSQLSLDEDGRAMECETKKVPMKKWIHMLEASQKQQQILGGDADNGGQDTVAKGEPNRIIYYLKDWHLQHRYSLAANGSTDKDSLLDTEDFFAGSRDSGCSLYTVPEFFGDDLLNSFLTRFTTGDYRFCYWGPSQSFTARHSDVLHSFSWSYNVVGTKEWTFYRSDHPSGGHNHNNDIDNDIDFKQTNHNADRSHNYGKTFTIIQETGEAIFVPATWQHKVVNLEETISINHNWITSSNLDLVWDCLRVEMVAIQNELRGWACGDNDNGHGLDQNTEACENMLRGCIGLDVTSFVLMTLVGLLEAVTMLISMPSPNAETVSDNSSRSCSQTEEGEGESHEILSAQQEELVLDILRLTSVLQDVTTTEEDIVRFRNRLSAVLQSDDMAQRVENMVKDLIEWIM